jgi:8-oxo-dGTP pyrophosphatase MutT (NUDIX family)
MKTDRSWGAVLYESGDGKDGIRRYGLVHHAGGGHWDHPKGHAEPGETPEQTALREIREETGVEARLVDGFVLETGWILPGGQPKKVTYFLAERVSAGIPDQDGEILANVWLPYSSAREKITWDTGKEILDQAESFLNDKS